MFSSDFDVAYEHCPLCTKCTKMDPLVDHETSGENNPMKIPSIQAIKHENKSK